MARWRPVVVLALLTIGCGVDRELPVTAEESVDMGGPETLTFPIVPYQSVRVDVLVVLDDAFSMSAHEEILEANADAFAHVLEADDVNADYRLAYVGGGEVGARDLFDRVESFILRSYDETAPEHGLIRPDANLHVVFISDGDDQSRDEDGELRDVEAFADFLRAVEASKLVLDEADPPRVLVSLLGGVQWDGSGFDPECGVAVPERLWSLAEMVDGGGGEPDVHRLCAPDHSPVMQAWAEKRYDYPDNCFPGCVADASNGGAMFEPRCETVEVRGDGERVVLPSCGPEWAVPEGHEACVTFLTDIERRQQCFDQGANVEITIGRAAPGLDHSHYLTTCTLAEELGPDCIPE